MLIFKRQIHYYLVFLNIVWKFRSFNNRWQNGVPKMMPVQAYTDSAWSKVFHDLIGNWIWAWSRNIVIKSILMTEPYYFFLLGLGCPGCDWLKITDYQIISGQIQRFYILDKSDGFALQCSLNIVNLPIISIKSQTLTMLKPIKNLHIKKLIVSYAKTQKHMINCFVWDNWGCRKV